MHQILIYISNKIIKIETPTMKQGLIQARVTLFGNISQRIKEFIHDKSAQHQTPFSKEKDALEIAKSHKAKRSLTDWRQLYSTAKYKIVPHTVYPFTAEGQRRRCSITGQCSRNHKAYSDAKGQSFQGDKGYITAQFDKKNKIERKRTSLISFAIAQRHYENQVFQGQRVQTAKQKRFYSNIKANTGQGNFQRGYNFLSKVSMPLEADLNAINATQKYISNLNRESQKANFLPFNRIKIKQRHKIDNSRFIQPRKALVSEYGLRYYQRG